MVKLVTAQEVKDRMVIGPELLGVNATIESALRAAHLRVETEYDSRLSRGVGDDTFYLDPLLHNGVRPGGMFRLYLSRAFLRQAPNTPPTTPIAVTYGDQSASDTFDVSGLKIDYEKGIVFVPEVYEKKYFRFVYEAGFIDAEKDYAPDWLRESILAYVPVVLNFSNKSNDDPKQEKMNRQSGDHAMAILAPYTRRIPFCHYKAF